MSPDFGDSSVVKGMDREDQKRFAKLMRALIFLRILSGTEAGKMAGKAYRGRV